MSVLTEADEERGHGLVLGHVDQPSAQTEVREDQQHLLDDVVGVGDVLGRRSGTLLGNNRKSIPQTKTLN